MGAVFGASVLEAAVSEAAVSKALVRWASLALLSFLQSSHQFSLLAL